MSNCSGRYLNWSPLNDDLLTIKRIQLNEYFIETPSINNLWASVNRRDIPSGKTYSKHYVLYIRYYISFVIFQLILKKWIHKAVVIKTEKEEGRKINDKKVREVFERVSVCLSFYLSVCLFLWIHIPLRCVALVSCYSKIKYLKYY